MPSGKHDESSDLRARLTVALNEVGRLRAQLEDAQKRGTSAVRAAETKAKESRYDEENDGESGGVVLRSALEAEARRCRAREYELAVLRRESQQAAAAAADKAAQAAREEADRTHRAERQQLLQRINELEATMRARTRAAQADSPLRERRRSPEWSTDRDPPPDRTAGAAVTAPTATGRPQWSAPAQKVAVSYSDVAPEQEPLWRVIAAAAEELRLMCSSNGSGSGSSETRRDLLLRLQRRVLSPLDVAIGAYHDMTGVIITPAPSTAAATVDVGSGSSRVATAAARAQERSSDYEETRPQPRPRAHSRASQTDELPSHAGHNGRSGAARHAAAPAPAPAAAAARGRTVSGQPVKHRRNSSRGSSSGSSQRSASSRSRDSNRGSRRQQQHAAFQHSERQRRHESPTRQQPHQHRQKQQKQQKQHVEYTELSSPHSSSSSRSSSSSSGGHYATKHQSHHKPHQHTSGRGRSATRLVDRVKALLATSGPLVPPPTLVRGIGSSHVPATTGMRQGAVEAPAQRAVIAAQEAAPAHRAATAAERAAAEAEEEVAAAAAATAGEAEIAAAVSAAATSPPSFESELRAAADAVASAALRRPVSLSPAGRKLPFTSAAVPTTAPATAPRVIIATVSPSPSFLPVPSHPHERVWTPVNAHAHRSGSRSRSRSRPRGTDGVSAFPNTPTLLPSPYASRGVAAASAPPASAPPSRPVSALPHRSPAADAPPASVPVRQLGQLAVRASAVPVAATSHSSGPRAVAKPLPKTARAAVLPEPTLPAASSSTAGPIHPSSYVPARLLSAGASKQPHLSPVPPPQHQHQHPHPHDASDSDETSIPEVHEGVLHEVAVSASLSVSLTPSSGASTSSSGEEDSLMLSARSAAAHAAAAKTPLSPPPPRRRDPPGPHTVMVTTPSGVTDSASRTSPQRSADREAALSSLRADLAAMDRELAGMHTTLSETARHIATAAARSVRKALAAAGAGTPVAVTPARATVHPLSLGGVPMPPVPGAHLQQQYPPAFMSPDSVGPQSPRVEGFGATGGTSAEAVESDSNEV